MRGGHGYFSPHARTTPPHMGSRNAQDQTHMYNTPSQQSSPNHRRAFSGLVAPNRQAQMFPNVNNAYTPMPTARFLNPPESALLTAPQEDTPRVSSSPSRNTPNHPAPYGADCLYCDECSFDPEPTAAEQQRQSLRKHDRDESDHSSPASTKRHRHDDFDDIETVAHSIRSLAPSLSSQESYVAGSPSKEPAENATRSGAPGYAPQYPPEDITMETDEGANSSNGEGKCECLRCSLCPSCSGDYVEEDCGDADSDIAMNDEPRHRGQDNAVSLARLNRDAALARHGGSLSGSRARPLPSDEGGETDLDGFLRTGPRHARANASVDLGAISSSIRALQQQTLHDMRVEFEESSRRNQGFIEDYQTQIREDLDGGRRV